MSITTNIYSPGMEETEDVRDVAWEQEYHPDPGGVYRIGISQQNAGKQRVFDFLPGYDDLTEAQALHLSWALGRAAAVPEGAEFPAAEAAVINPSLARLVTLVGGAVGKGYTRFDARLVYRLAGMAGARVGEPEGEAGPAGEPEEEEEEEEEDGELAALAAELERPRARPARVRVAEPARPAEPRARVAAAAAAAEPEGEADLIDVIGGAVAGLWNLLTFRDALNFEPMPWLELQGAARWAGPGDMPARVRRAFEAEPERFDGCCVYLALAASGMPLRALDGGAREAPERGWAAASGGRIVAFLGAHSPVAWRIYDVTARQVHAGGPAPGVKARKGCAVFVGGLGHFAALRNARARVPVRLRREGGGAPFAELDKALFGRLRAPNTLEVDAFYARCGIRAPRRGAGAGAALSLGVDLNAAYPTILQDHTCVFPVPALGDRVVEYASALSERVRFDAFMLVRLESEAERRVFGSAPGGPEAPFGWAWVWGGALERVRGVGARVACRGLFRVSNHACGRALAEVPEAAELLGLFAEQRGFEDRAKAAKVLLCEYSGWIEAAASNAPISAAIPARVLAPGEVRYLTCAWTEPDPVDGSTADFHVVTRGGEQQAQIARRTSFRSTGKLAKLAVYSYTAARLLEICALAGAPPDELRTDAAYWAARPPGYWALRDATERPGCPWKYVFDPEDADAWPRASAAGERAWAPGASRVVPPEVPPARPEEVLGAERLDAFLSGPAGVGKTHWVEAALAPEAARRGLEVVRLTPTRNLAEAHAGYRTLASFLSGQQTRTRLALRAQRQVLVLDEAGLCSGHEFVDLAALRPAGLVLLGDAAQLGEVDIPRAARFLRLPEVAFDLHARDRYGGDPAMHAVVRLCREAALAWEAAGRPRGGCPPRLVEALRELVPFAAAGAAPPPGAVVVGWRHGVVDPLGGATVHAIQGRTIPEAPIHVVDWEWADPRLVYTAVTRARAAGQLTLYVGTPQPGGEATRGDEEAPPPAEANYEIDPAVLARALAALE